MSTSVLDKDEICQDQLKLAKRRNDVNLLYF